MKRREADDEKAGGDAAGGEPLAEDAASVEDSEAVTPADDAPAPATPAE